MTYTCLRHRNETQDACSQLLLVDDFEAEGREFVAIAVVKLILELHPVQPQRMEERRQRFHHHKNAQCRAREHEESCRHQGSSSNTGLDAGFK